MLRNKNKITILQLKDKTNISELNSFFTSSEKVCETVLWIIRSLKFSGKGFEFPESDRTIYGSGTVLTFLLLFPLFQLSNVRAFSQSVLAKLFGVGRIWSHVSNSSILGFKGLFLGYHDGKSFFSLDFSLH